MILRQSLRHDHRQTARKHGEGRGHVVVLGVDHDLGVAAQRIPYVSGGARRGLDRESGLYRDQVVAFQDARADGAAAAGRRASDGVPGGQRLDCG
jgi:hypothetical protein